MRCLLDTSAYSRLKQGDAATADAVCQADSIVVSPVVIGELEFGFSMGGQEKRNRDELNQFLTGPRVGLVSMGIETAFCYALIFKSLRLAGTPVPTNDIWIAASAMEHGLILLTADTHYNYISHVRVAFLGS